MKMPQKKDPIWLEVSKSRNNVRNPEAYYEHFLEMKAALKLARSDITDFPYKSVKDVNLNNPDDNEIVDNTDNTYTYKLIYLKFLLKQIEIYHVDQ